MSVNLQVRMPKQLIKLIDEDVKDEIFTSRSDAVRTIVAFYEYQKERNEFYGMLEKRADEVKAGKYISLEAFEKEALK